MLTFKRRIANAIERLSGNYVLAPSDLHRVHEWNQLRRLLAFLDVDCVFDVGANKGQYAQMLRDRAGFEGLIVSFEPQPDLLPGLRQLAEADGRWHVVEAALSRAAGTATFHVMQGDEFSSLLAPLPGQMASVERDGNRVARKVEVRLSTIAAELPAWRERLGFQRAFLKMDTQGHDLDVLAGAGEAIHDFVGLQSELSFRPVYENQPDFAQAVAAYRRAGFDLSGLVPNNEGHFPVLAEMDGIFLRRDLVPAQLRWEPPGGW